MYRWESERHGKFLRDREEERKGKPGGEGVGSGKVSLFSVSEQREKDGESTLDATSLVQGVAREARRHEAPGVGALNVESTLDRKAVDAALTRATSTRRETVARVDTFERVWFHF